jgi:hypothetical protein
MSGFYIVYPEKRWVTAKQIHTWFEDALDNGEIADEYTAAKTAVERAKALDDAGLLTQGRPR